MLGYGKLVCLTSLLLGVDALYEDQIFKFDWRAQHLGKVDELRFYSSDLDPLLIVGTQKNVIAALDSDNGRILWRHKFEEDAAIGQLRALSLLGKHLVSVSGTNQLFLRIWEPNKGSLNQEHFVRLKTNPSLVHVSKSRLWTIYLDPHSGVKIISYSFDTKKLGEARAQDVPGVAGAGPVENCVVGRGDVLVCSVEAGLMHVNLKTDKEFTLMRYPESAAAAAVSGGRLMAVGAYVQVEGDAGSMLTYKLSQDGLIEVAGAAVASKFSECPGLEVSQACEEKGVDADGVGYCSQYARDVTVSLKGAADQLVRMPEARGRLEKVWSECSADPDAYQLILGFEDGGVVSVTPRGNIMFTREEGLASIQKVEMVSMGFQDQNFPMRLFTNENMLDPASLAQNFVNRLKRHVSQLQNLIVSLSSFRLSDATKTVATPDRFGLNKVIVAVTEHNKMYGLESISGKILWQTMFPGVFDASLPSFKPQTYLLVQKDGRSGGYAQAVLVYKHSRSVHFMMTFNPLTGVVSTNEPLTMPLDQAILLPELPEHELKPILLIGKDRSAEIHPANAASCLKQGPPLFVAVKSEPGTLTGNRVVVNSAAQIQLVPVWSLVSPNTEILSVHGRSPEDHIHSAGRVLADRSVLFKYMNPNLALVLAQGTDSTAKTFISVYLLDLVTGRVFYSASHKKVLPPFHVVHSENWAVYTFFNDKSRRTELVSIELYEGKSQANASVFSSIENPVSPLVERQAYILPSSEITAIKETITEQGITSKHLLIGTSLGNIVDLPVHMVDPRRPPLDSPVHVREPGIPPYIPELPVPHESILNYNQTVLGIRNIVTSPSGLESTSLVFVYGLDMYGTRVAPSKGFDLIKEDFDYLMIAAVIAGLVLASYVTRKLSQKKMLSQAWK